MYDFRKNLQSSSEQKNSVRQSSYQGREIQNNKFRPLSPIKENENARVSQLPPPSRSLIRDPDNNIMFLDNGSRIVNPVNIKTPPPPFWGEILEEENYDPDEDFYDHQKALLEKQHREQEKKNRVSSRKILKKKIVYVYESDSDEEGSNIKGQNGRMAQSVIQLKSQDGMARQYYTQSTRGQSIDGRNENQGQSRQQVQYKLPSIQQQSTFQYQKPPLPSSQLKQLSNQLPASRQIRTGGFQKLPTIGLLQNKH